MVKMENFGWSFFSGITSAFIIFLIQRYYTKRDNNELEKLRSDLQKEMQIFSSKQRMNSELQFKLYNELWADLSGLEIIVECLWSESLTPSKLKELARVVKQTDKKVKESALIIEEKDFVRLEKILETLKNYQVGKQKILSMEVIDQRASDEFQRQLDQNFDLLSDYINLKKEMFKSMKERIGL